MKNNQKPDYGAKRQFCSFHLGERLFGVDILDVKEINPDVALTPIFHASKEVKGYVNICGQIHLILDLRLMLGLEGAKIGDMSRLVLFKPDVGESFGIIVDRIGDVLEVGENLIEDRRKEKKGAPDGIERRSQALGSGVYRLEQGLLVILNSRSLLKQFASKRVFGQDTKNCQ